MPHNPTLSFEAIEGSARQRTIARSVWRSRGVLLLVATLVAVGVAFRVWQLDHVPGLNGDEAWSGVQALKLLHGDAVAWRTPTGNLLNIFFCAPLVVLHALYAPSIALLRTVSVVSGILALVANYWLCRRVFDAMTAVVSTTLLAVLPINIAYSRFAWDASQTLLATTVVLFLALDAVRHPKGGWYWLGVAMAVIAAIVVHPTNVFIAPLVCVCGWQSWLARPVWTQGPLLGRWLAAIVVAISVAAGIVFWPWITPVLCRVVSPIEILEFVVDLGRLFSGATAYRFISGGVGSNQVDVTDVVTWCIGAIVIKGIVEQTRSSHGSLDSCLANGLALSLVGFYLVAGPRGVMPHYERYAIWTVGPTALLVARSWGYWNHFAGRYRQAAVTGALAVVLLLLGGFYINYFKLFAVTGGESHLAFHTADVDPKLDAFDYILLHRNPVSSTTIVSENWWTRLPLEYFALGSTTPVRVISPNEFAFLSEIDRQNCWFVELVGSDDERAAIDRLKMAGIGIKRIEETDYAGRPVVVIIRGAEKSVEEQKNSSSPQFDNSRS